MIAHRLVELQNGLCVGNEGRCKFTLPILINRKGSDGLAQLPRESTQFPRYVLPDRLCDILDTLSINLDQDQAESVVTAPGACLGSDDW